jgi:hypothetical protein
LALARLSRKTLIVFGGLNFGAAHDLPFQTTLSGLSDEVRRGIDSILWLPEFLVLGGKVLFYHNLTARTAYFFLTRPFFRAIVPIHEGSPAQHRDGHVFDNNKHMHNHIHATIGRAGSVTN